MQRKIYTIFVAGGSGTRMGAGKPKQFLELGGLPILQRTIEKFIEAVPDLTVITVLPRDHFETWRQLCADNSFLHPQILVEGGMTRFHSVKNALSRVPDGAIVAIHDGVRPLLSVGMIRRMFASMEDHRAVIPTLPMVDSLKFTDGTLPEPDRSKIVAVQTPQIFLSEEIKDAYNQAYSLEFTDDASVAARKEIPLTFVDGERKNIKITTPEDLEWAELFIASRS